MDIVDGSAHEREKYSEIWSRFPEYRKHSPGLENVERFLKVMQPKPGATIIDLGCGEGVAGLAFEAAGLNVDFLDITDAGLKPEVAPEQFHRRPLWEPIPMRTFATIGERDRAIMHNRRFDYGFCCDVLEHIPPEYTMLCIRNIVDSCDKAWLQIALRPDEFGQLIGEPLHLTVQPFTWWLTRIATIASVLDARDLCGDGLFIISREAQPWKG